MTKLVGFSISFVLSLGLLVFQPPSHGVSAQTKNVPAPAFTLKLLDGGDLKSSDLAGKIQVLKFVASY